MSVRPRWVWRLVQEEGSAPPEPVFTSRFDAEQWLGERWRDLAAQGVVQVTLLHEGEPVAAPIDLSVPTSAG
jgi:hypothetical protein